MEAMLWTLETKEAFALFWPLLAAAFFIFFFTQGDFLAVLVRWLWEKVVPQKPRTTGPLPAGLVIIPSLLRDDDDFSAITLTADACARNEYPGELIIFVGVDGMEDSPKHNARLKEWIVQQNYPPNIHVHVAGNRTRLGKMMAVEAAVKAMQGLVSAGVYAQFPPIYFSIDGDGTLGENALEVIARKLLLPHFVSGNPRRVVAGKVCIRPDLFWKGFNLESLKLYFTVPGQIFWQVAREFVFSNVSRFNMKARPQIGIPGALYATWSEVLLRAPRFMGYMKTITFWQWVKWWFGAKPPQFAESTAPPLPEALTGSSDDTCISFIAAMSTWEHGRLVLKTPRTPLHALGRMIKSYFWERSPDYEPEARVFTFTPSTIKTLWIQRVRWNASRFECGYRFKNAFAFHWEVGAWLLLHLWLTMSNILIVAVYYLVLPKLILGGSPTLVGYVLGYSLQVFTYSFFTILALVVEKDWRRFWPVIFALPMAPFYSVAINFSACLTGVVKDLLIYGNTTKFAPEWTYKKGLTVRLALLFRVRRFLALCVRAVVKGDVPWGAFWFGWVETPWTPSGYDGWTTGKRARIVPPVNEWFKPAARSASEGERT
ncbi:MAG TPA: glycosyltransferase family 2 protein [Archangium sp.]